MINTANSSQFLDYYNGSYNLKKRFENLKLLKL